MRVRQACVNQTRRTYAESLSGVEAQICLRPRSEPDTPYGYGRRDAPPHGSLWGSARSRSRSGRQDVRDWDGDLAWGWSPRRYGYSRQMAPARDRVGETQHRGQGAVHTPRTIEAGEWITAVLDLFVHAGYSQLGGGGARPGLAQLQYGPAFLDRMSTSLWAPPSYSNHSLQSLLRDPRIPPLCLVLHPWYPHHRKPVILNVFT